jgi:hypothetical protein
MSGVIPTCSICQRPVEVESSKTDENGKAIHEDCYVSKLSQTRLGKRPPKADKRRESA